MKREVQLSGRFFIVASLLGLLSAAGLPINQPVKAVAGSRQAFVSHPSTTGMTGDIIFAKLLEHNRLREARLRQYSARLTSFSACFSSSLPTRLPRTLPP